MRLFETEQKYRVKDPKAVRCALKKLKAKKIVSGREINEFFDRQGTLSKRKIALRLRRFGKEVVLTLKGPKLASRFTKRMEVETLADYEPVKTVLRLSGFKVIRKYEKHRELYRLGEASIVLDHLKKFGWFLEIEAPSRTIAKLERKLGLQYSDREKKSYLHMLFGWKH